MDPITRKLYWSDLKPVKTFQIPGLSLPLMIMTDANGVLTIRWEEKVKNYGSQLYLESIKKK